MNDTDTSRNTQRAALKQLLEKKSTRLFSLRWLWLAGAVLLIAGAALLYFRSGHDSKAPRYLTEPVTVDTLVVKVSATGNLQPTNQVDVGSELSGIIEQVYVDVNDQVKKGQVLARLDISKLRDAVAKSRANLVAAEAQILQTRATVAEARATLTRYRQVAQLSGGKVPSKSEMDTAEANLKRAEANEAGARASVAQARAILQSEETDLTKASIRSPINGVVLSREVEPGQTVAASFQAPVLFTLA
ncbi:MAG TPA: biotin/lipoyl-binding protein, partial [Geobacteraceae bacterium]|nr:biotin/lipoyl-binding protein [Geobacteraceae bacterium]